MLATIRKLADGLIGLSATIGALGLIAVLAVILVDVIGRALGHPLYGSQDLITMTMVILVFGGMALCDRLGGHISVDLFEKFYPGPMNRLIDIVAALIGAIIFFAISWSVWAVVALNLKFNISSLTNLLHLPINWFRIALCVLALATAVGMLLRAVELTLTGRDIRREKRL